MKTVAVINQKGGVGKTTTSISLASELAASGNRVLLVDLDSQGNATSGLGYKAGDKDTNVITDLASDGVGLSDVVVEVSSSLDLLPGGSRLASFSQDIADVEHKESFVKGLLAGMEYDYAILDCPPSLGQMTVNALTASTDVLIPVQAEYYALEGLGQLLQLIDRAKATVNPELEVLGIAITMYDKRNTLAKDVKSQLDQHFGDKVFETIIPRNVRLAEAPSHGQAIRDYDKWSRGARAYKALAKEVVARHG